MTLRLTSSPHSVSAVFTRLHDICHSRVLPWIWIWIAYRFKSSSVYTKVTSAWLYVSGAVYGRFTRTFGAASHQRFSTQLWPCTFLWTMSRSCLIGIIESWKSSSHSSTTSQISVHSAPTLLYTGGRPVKHELSDDSKTLLQETVSDRTWVRPAVNIVY